MDAKVRHLHTHERVLHSTHLSRFALVGSVCRGCIEGGMFGGIVGGGVGISLGVLPGIGIALLCIAAAIAVRFHGWHAIQITITTQRILFQGHASGAFPSPFRTRTETVRWDHYQESIFSGGLFSSLLNIGTLTIRYGTADGGHSLRIPMLPWASDLKHYCDKIHSLRSAQIPDSAWPGFITAARGKRSIA